MRRVLESTPVGASLRGRASRAFLSVAVLCCGVLAFGSASAFAAYSLVGSFGGPGSGAEQFEAPGRIAVEASTGAVFVNAGVDLNDVQTVTPPSSGTFTLVWEGLIHEHKAIKTGAQGMGKLESTSKKSRSRASLAPPWWVRRSKGAPCQAPSKSQKSQKSKPANTNWNSKKTPL